MAYTKMKKKMLENMPVEERERTVKIERMERRLEKKRNRGEIIGLMNAYDQLVEQWYSQFERLNSREE